MTLCNKCYQPHQRGLANCPKCGAETKAGKGQEIKGMVAALKKQIDPPKLYSIGHGYREKVQ